MYPSTYGKRNWALVTSRSESNGFSTIGMESYGNVEPVAVTTLAGPSRTAIPSGSWRTTSCYGARRPRSHRWTRGIRYWCGFAFRGSCRPAVDCDGGTGQRAGLWRIASAGAGASSASGTGGPGHLRACRRRAGRRAAGGGAGRIAGPGGAACVAGFGGVEAAPAPGHGDLSSLIRLSMKKGAPRLLPRGAFLHRDLPVYCTDTCSAPAVIPA